jgi:hypothetical protein
MIVIDPGQSGGIVSGPIPLDVQPMPKTYRELCLALAPPGYWVPGERVAYLEDLVKYTGRNMPSSSMAVYASNWGFINGCLTTSGYRIVIVPPKKWQAALGLGKATGMTKTEWKNKLKNRAEQLFPHIKVTLATADALLMYEAARLGKLG